MTLRLGLLVPDLGARNGWSSYSLDLLRALDAAGVELTLITAQTTPPAGLPAEPRPLLPRVTPFERGFTTRLLAAVPAVRAALRGCAVVHAALEPYAPAGALAAGGRPLVVTIHGSYAHLAARPAPVGLLYRRAFRRAALVCVSRYTAGVIAGLLPGAQTVVVNNGVDAARFVDLPPLDPPETRPTVLSVGAVKARKGTLWLVRAMAAVVRRFPDARCVIAGSLTAEPAYVAQVQAEIAALGLGDVVRLTGHLPEAELLAWYGAARVFALPSVNSGWKFEGYGLALIEASAAGLPVIGTHGCGAEDAVDDGQTGLLVAQADADALAAAINTLLADPALAAAMGAAGRAKARRQTWAQVAEQMIALYEDVR